MPLRIEADYLLETAFDPRARPRRWPASSRAAPSSPVPGETPELKARAAARVEALEVVDARSGSRRCRGPAVPKGGAATWRRARVTLSWPLDNLGPSLPNLLATVAGNLFELKQLSGLRLLDLRLPAAFADAYPGPQFGIAGTRRLAGVEGRPADRHHHQAERRPGAGGDGGAGARRCARPASTSSRTTSCRPTARTARSTSGCAP